MILLNTMNALIKKIFSPRDNQSLKEAIEDLIDDHEEDAEENGHDLTDSHERTLISNILKLQEELEALKALNNQNSFEN